MRFSPSEPGAGSDFPRLLDQVERGEMITITKYGREVARLVPVTTTSAKPDDIIAALRMTNSSCTAAGSQSSASIMSVANRLSRDIFP